MRSLQLLLPALIPSWRFFKTVAPSPRLQVRRDGAWCPVPPPAMPLTPLAVLRRLVWNPDWNAHLYSVTLSEKLVETQQAEVEARLRAYIAQRLGRSGEATEFRLLFVHRNGDRLEHLELFRSEEG